MLVICDVLQDESIRRRGDWDEYMWRRDHRDASICSRRPGGAGDNQGAALATDLQNIKSRRGIKESEKEVFPLTDM